MLRLVLASNNAKKLAELQALLAGLPLQLVTQGSLGIAEADEPHHTFIENALAKARQAARASGGAALADDSGLCVGALGGAGEGHPLGTARRGRHLQFVDEAGITPTDLQRPGDGRRRGGIAARDSRRDLILDRD